MVAVNPYRVLGVSPRANPQQIRQAYREKSKQYHPDTTELPAPEAATKFQELNAAYAVLSSPERRLVYDRLQETLARQKRAQNFSSRDDDGLPEERELSGGEQFALLAMGLTLLICTAAIAYAL
ncbi:MAG: J domain-containing protein [Oscillatoriales cyanobacterium SM2_1_8]|nr:J domain-containing protein [Oscillatoriales cyanobacterium SM2_1_8]